MKGQATINKKDIWETWGASLAKGCYEALLKPAPMKDYIVNESRLEHGVHVVVNNPRITSREITLKFFIEGKNLNEYYSRFQSFINELEKGAITLYIDKLKRNYELVYIESSSYGDFGLKRGKLAVKFLEPQPK